MKICCDFPLCKKFKKNQDRIIYPKRKKGFGLCTLTPLAWKKKSDYRSTSLRGDDGGNDTLDLNCLCDDGGS